MVVEVQEGSELAELLVKAEAGEEITLVREGRVVARLTPSSNTNQAVYRELGTAKGMFTVPDDFNAPLLHEIYDARGDQDENPA